MAEIILSEKDIRRFWSKVDRRGPDDCWEWTRGINTGGYGQFCVGGRKSPTNLPASRAAWMVSFGQIQAGLNVCHKCDNRMCCNPSHLFLGTAMDNVQDSVRKGRNVRGSKSRMCTITEAAAVAIRKDIEASDDKYSEIALRNRVSFSIVAAIAGGKCWKHLGPPLARGRRAGPRHQCVKHGPEISGKILSLVKTGMSTRQAAIRTGVNEKTAYDIVNGTHWSVRKNT